MVLLKKLKITHKITIIVICGILISGALALLNTTMGNKHIDTLESIYNENVTPLDNLRKIQLIFRELEFRMTGVLADVIAAVGAGEHLKVSIENIDAAWTEVKSALASYDLTDESRKEMENYENGYEGFKKNIVPKLQEVYFNNEAESVEELYDEWLEYKPLVMKSIDRFADLLKENVKSNYMESKGLVLKINKIVAVVSIVVIGVFIGIAMLTIRSIKKPLNTVVDAAEHIAGGDLTRTINVTSEDEMGSMSRRLNLMIEKIRNAFRGITGAVESMSADTAGLNDLSRRLLEGAEEQRAKGEQVAVSSTEMAQTIMEVAQNTAQATDVTKESFDAAVSGKEIVVQAVASIKKLAESVSEASGTIDGLGQNLSEIDEIVSVIQDIADQTNLLALNAAIEAARSGEHGRGFAVVADEVRKLAERTAKATDEIASKINKIQAESKSSMLIMGKGTTLAEESVTNAEKAGEALQKIVESSDSVMDIVQRVAAATEEQSSAAEEVSQTMEHISGIINEHCSLAGEVEKAASSLSLQARKIMDQTSYFKTGDDSKGHSVPQSSVSSKDAKVAGTAHNI